MGKTKTILGKLWMLSLGTAALGMMSACSISTEIIPLNSKVVPQLAVPVTVTRNPEGDFVAVALKDETTSIRNYKVSSAIGFTNGELVSTTSNHGYKVYSGIAGKIISAQGTP